MNKELKISSHKGYVIWFTGLSGAGKTTLAEALQKKMLENNVFTKILDGDILRNGINSGLGFSDNDRKENIRRAAEVAKLFIESNIITLCSFITPTNEMRNIAKNIIGENYYIEVFVNCSLELCELRDVKGLYKKARSGSLSNFTGISADFELPLNPNIEVNTGEHTIEECVNQIFTTINKRDNK